jgi:hypothetical protein
VRRLLPLALLLVALGGPTGPAAALPPGEPSLTITTYAGGVDATTSIQVRLLLVWPAGADQVVVTNGDGASQTFPVADSLDWQLVPVAPDRPAETKTVTATYTGPGLASVVTSDSILLDTLAPRLPVQRLFQNGRGWFLATRVEDRGSGVRSIALLGKTGAAITGVELCSSSLCPPVTDLPFFLKRARPRVARITDAAGNSKVVRLVRRATTCSQAGARYPVFTLEQGYYDCVRDGERCRPDDGHFWNRSAYARCRKVAGHYRVVVVASGA